MSALTVLDGEDEVRAAVGRDLGGTDWFEITAERLADFDRAASGAPTQYLAIGVSNMFLPQIVEVRGFAMGINYGTDEVRFGGALEAGDRVRARASLDDVSDVRGGIQTRMAIVVEIEGRADACTIASLSRWLH